ncbi:MAG: PA domain-containing protein [Saprospiraceae bacterium]
MKKLLTNFVFLALLVAPAILAAQGTHNSGADSIRIRIKTGATSFIDVRAGNCGYGVTNAPTTANPAWGGTLDTNLCAPIVWGYGLNQDTFGCAALPAGSLTGKIALLRRGPIAAPCGFSAKALNAQNAGAIAVIVANHHETPADTDCTVLGMTGGAEAAQVTIPAYSVCRAVGTQIDAAIRSAGGAEICILRPDVEMDYIYLPTASKRTPVSQIPVDTLGFAANLYNKSKADLTNFVIKADVFDANNNLLHTTNKVLTTFARGVADSFQVISQGQFAPELPVGEYTVRYTTTADGGNGIPDVEVTKFFVTNNLFSKDDGPVLGYRTATPATPYGVACLYTLNPKVTDKYMVKTLQFQFATNAGELAPQDVGADVALFKVKDFVDFNNFGGTFTERNKFYSNSFDWVGTALYDAPAGTTSYSDQSVDLTDLATGLVGVEVEAGKRYMAAIQYTGNNKLVFHAFDDDKAAIGYPSMFIFWPDAAGSTNNQWYSGFANEEGLSVILRMFLDLVVTTDENPLPETAMQVRPNPIVETLNLQMSFAQATDVTVTIADLTGRVIQYEVREGLTNDLLTYQLPELASGTYFARIATTEGTLTKKFVVQK